MATLILKNEGISALSIDDLGIFLNASESLDLITNCHSEDIIESTDIQTAMEGDVTVKLNDTTELTYAELIDYLTALTKYDTIDYAYISSKDSNTDITGAELEALTDGSDASAGTALHSHDTSYYTKTQLETSGQSEIAWGNIAGVPAFGSLSWKDPVDRTDASYGSGTMLPTSDNVVNDARVVADDGDGSPAQYVCVAISGAWDVQWKKIADIDWGAANGISVSPVGNLTSTDIQDALEELQGDIDDIVDGTIDITYDLDDAYNDGSTITVDTTDVLWNLSDTRDFNIRSDGGSTEILSVAASATGDVVTINGKLDVNGGAITLDGTAASNLTVTAANLTISTTTSGNISISSAGALTLKDQYLSSGIAISQSGTTGLTGFTATSIVGALNELKSGSITVTLDGAYDGSGNGAGRTITADQGAVKIDASSSTYAPLELTSLNSAPSSGLGSGQLAVIGGELYCYDSTRTKWLSTMSVPLIFTDDVASGKYLNIGEANNTTTGIKIPFDATIVAITAQAGGGNATKGLELRKNGSATALKSFSLSSSTYTSTNDNINLTADDFVQIYATAVGTNVQDIVVTVYLKWRKA